MFRTYCEWFTWHSSVNYHYVINGLSSNIDHM
jgi:hypothetical protein